MDIVKIKTDVDNAHGATEHANTAVGDADTPVEHRMNHRGGTALTILATIALIFTLQWASNFFIPLIFGIFVAYTLNPLVAWLERIKIPRIVGTSLVMLGLIGTTALVASSVYTEVQTIVDDLPFATYKLTRAIKASDDGGIGTMEKIRNAADAIKEATEATPKAQTPQTPATGEPALAAAPTPAPASSAPQFNLNDWLWAGSVSAATFVGQLTMMLFLVFFALLSGNTFKRKLVKLTGPSLTEKKITVHLLDEINTNIQRYMLMLLITNTTLALATWAALHLIGLDNAGAWAVAAGLLHIIPYFGPLIIAILTGLAALLQFESLSMMFLVAAIMLIIATLIGTLVTTWMTGRIAKMNATAVFVALLFGGWLWGVWGMLLCVPLIVVTKVIASHVEGMEPLAELLGD